MGKQSKSTSSSTKLNNLISLAGKCALITGAGAGMGQAIALRFAEAGAKLLLIDVDPKSLQETEQLLADGQHGSYVFDLADKTAIDGFWHNLPDSKLPDILINNAGIFPMQEFTDIDADFLQNVMDVNFSSVFWMSQHFIKRHLQNKNGGVIVNISSIEASVAFKSDMAHYASSKAGVLALTRALAKDYGKDGFRINALMPGGVNTPGTKKLFKQALRKVDLSLFKTGYDFKQRLSLGRIGEPDDIARATLFLASDLSSYVHGACLPVDGGFLSS